MTHEPRKITVAHGDGIGPEIMAATLEILERAGAQLDIDTIEIGKAVYESGVPNGIDDSAWKSLNKTKIFLKAPITTPQGGGFKSLNVTIRKQCSLYANVRPCVAFAPFVETDHPDMNLVIIRENEEDLYGGIEYRQSQDVMASMKIISRPGCERIARYAFEYARANGRKKITCMTKDNIMKMSDGMFHRIFDEIGAEYPDIEQDHMIIDIGTAKVAAHPEMFDVILTANLYGDIVSDVAAEVTGSVGLGGSCNIGADFAMFEAVHGSAPDIAGQGIANPSGLLLGAVMMLVHIGQADIAQKIHNAWLKTIEDGIHTGDIYREGQSTQRVGTADFSDAVIARLGQEPSTLTPIDYSKAPSGGLKVPPVRAREDEIKERIGIDVGINWDGSAEDLASAANTCVCDNLRLQMISNRGTKVWPDGNPNTFCADKWRLRFLSNDEEPIKTSQAIALLNRMNEAGMNYTDSVMLHTFNGDKGFTVAQGE